MDSPTVMVSVRVPRELHARVEVEFGRVLVPQLSHPTTWTAAVIVALERWLIDLARQEVQVTRRRDKRRKAKDMLPAPQPDHVVEGRP